MFWEVFLHSLSLYSHRFSTKLSIQFYGDTTSNLVISDVSLVVSLLPALGMAYTAIVQHLIYSTEPNFNYDTKPCSNCQTFNNINVAWQLPSYVFLAFSDMFAYISGLEYAFTKAPASMKSIVVSLYLYTAAIGGVFNMVLIPVNIDPKLLWMYASIAIVTFVTAVIFVVIFRNEEKQTIPELPPSRRASIMSMRGYS